MASKLAHSPPIDEKRELQKQLGCMNGIFQLFDRRYFLGQQRGSTTIHNHKRLPPPPPPPGQSGNNEMELTERMEKDPKRLAKEKQRFSVESSRTSFSSTCSSTEPSSSSKSIFPEPSSPVITIQQPTHLKPLNLRDLVKDSMLHRESRSVSVKTTPKDEGVNRPMKHIDSPRPLQQQKSVQPRACSLDKSNRNLPAALSNYSQEKDAPRFSYDGRISQSKLKSSVKLKELPRLSLDSRESSIRGSALGSRKNLLRDTPIINLDHEPGSNKRASGLVAKLMGLEALPDPSIDDQGTIEKIKPNHENYLVNTKKSSIVGEEVEHSQIFGSPRVSCKEAASPRMGIANTAAKQHANSRLPLEAAPWRQERDKKGSQKPALKITEVPMMNARVFPSVYGEIEKRLTDLEFKKSGKDLRALKQILEAMQKTRKRLENTEQYLDLESRSSKCVPDHGSWDQHKHSVSPSVKGNGSPKRGQFPIMVIKPAKSMGKPIISDAKETSGLHKLRTNSFDSSNDLGDPSAGPLPSPEKKSNTRTLRPSLSPRVPENITGERLTGSRRTSDSGSPRLQQKRQETEKQSSPRNLSDFSRGRKETIKKSIRSEGPTKTVKLKSSNSQLKNDQSFMFNKETRNLSQLSDTVSMQSESNSSLASQNDKEVTARLKENGLIAQLATASLEQPSPVSVLDATIYGEESPSPVKKISNAFRDYGTLIYDDAEWNQEVIDHLPSSRITNGWSQFNNDKLEHIRQLVDRITLLNSSPKDATVNITVPIFENRHPDHVYITEIFLASGFLENLRSWKPATQLHSAGHLIDPNLFHVLEKSKQYTELTNYEHCENSVGSKTSDRSRRKLIFDTVDEILVRKLAFAGSSELWNISNKVRRIPSGEKLLEEVWSEINNLQDNLDNSLDEEDDELICIIKADVLKKSGDWEGYNSENQGLVLDIERMIFKDLISEVVSSGLAGLLDQSVRHCKKLFPM